MSSLLPDNPLPLSERAIASLHQLLVAKTVATTAPEEFAQIAGYQQLYAMMLEIRTGIMAFANGDLSYPITHKGYLPGAIKALQASLNHLTWQTKMIAGGDFSQRVDFMGDFSEAFNGMVQQLAESTQKLEVLAHIDSLTGINNRRHFMERLGAELDRTRRYSRPLSLLILDLDHFKSVNDSRGHAAGDAALQAICAVFANCGLRNSDFPGRLGGEEFALVLPETTVDCAREVAERLRKKIAATVIHFEDQHFSITASIGVGQYHDPETLATLLKRADLAMYHAKTSGRNRVCLAP